LRYIRAKILVSAPRTAETSRADRVSTQPRRLNSSDRPGASAPLSAAEEFLLPPHEQNAAHRHNPLIEVGRTPSSIAAFFVRELGGGGKESQLSNIVASLPRIR
jgi:hypothetical protein